MSKAMTAPVLEPVGEGMVALQSVNVEAVIENLLCQVTVKQSYRNLEKTNIEAVYTFPLPLGAVLLDMTIKTPAKELKGVVVEKPEAEDRYEEAITDGDTAIMLEQVDPGLYTMNVGNLQPEDTIDISITYVELFKWRDNSLRFYLPTTVAPRYGDPGSLGVQPHQAPEYDLTNENPFSVTVSISGMLAGAAIESPSHKIVSESQNGKTVVTSKKGQALMDRDFVLNLSVDAAAKSAAHVEPDGEGYVALASFYPRLPSTPERTPRCVTIIVDCSGSMGGDSIAQARKALYEIFELLRPEDMFNVVRFGSTHQMLFPSPVSADAGNLKTAKNLLEVLDADMGGTEIGQAVVAAIHGAAQSKLSKEALLLTDGNVWDWEEVTQMAAKSGVRFFTVGVGSSVSESFVRTLADVTGGACELVSPNEAMAEKIVRHFKRIYSPKAGNVEVRWPGEPEKAFPEQVAVYDGDTLHAFGRFKARPEGAVELRADVEGGGTLVERVPLEAIAGGQPPSSLPGTTARMAAAREMRGMEDAGEIAALGVKYQLMSRYTSYLAIDAKAEDEKARDLPALRKTPQMLAAGWGGSGTVMQSMVRYHGFTTPMPSTCEMACSDENLQQVLFPEMLPGRAYKRRIKKLLNAARKLSEQSSVEHKKLSEKIHRQLHREITVIQKEMFSLQENKLVQFIENIQTTKKEILIEEIEKYLKSSTHDYMRIVSEIFDKEMHEYEKVVRQLCHNEVDQFKDLIHGAPIFDEPVESNKWVEFGESLERNFRLQGAVKKLLTIEELQKMGVPDGFASFLKSLMKDNVTETEVVCAFLYALLHHPVQIVFSRETKRIIRKQYKDVTPDEKLSEQISIHLISENQS